MKPISTSPAGRPRRTSSAGRRARACTMAQGSRVRAATRNAIMRSSRLHAALLGPPLQRRSLVTMLERIQTGLGDIGEALRRPEEFVVRWRDRGAGQHPSPAVFAVLLVNAAIGLAAYGLSLDLHHGVARMALAGLKLPLAAGAAWAIALPALARVGAGLVHHRAGGAHHGLFRRARHARQRAHQLVLRPRARLSRGARPGERGDLHRRRRLHARRVPARDEGARAIAQPALRVGVAGAGRDDRRRACGPAFPLLIGAHHEYDRIPSSSAGCTEQPSRHAGPDPARPPRARRPDPRRARSPANHPAASRPGATGHRGARARARWRSASADATAVDWRGEPQLQETRALRARRARCRPKSESVLEPFRISVGTPPSFGWPWPAVWRSSAGTFRQGQEGLTPPGGRESYVDLSGSGTSSRARRRPLRGSSPRRGSATSTC